MNGVIPNGTPKHPLKMYVLEEQTPEDVARAMITEGGQTEPFHVFDADEAYRRMRHFQQVLPRVRVFYAMKVLDYDWLLKLAVSQGFGFDCSSPGEIKKLLELDVDPSRIIYAMPTKTADQMVYARECGVRHTTFDSSYELKKVKLYWTDVKLLIRIKIDSNCTYKLGDKFGCDFEKEAFALLDEAASLGLNVVGVAFHVGSICTSVTSYVDAITQARALFDHEASAGRSMTVLDIGGGFLSEQTSSIDPAVALINEALEQYFPDPNVHVIAEPGRYICDSSLTLYCSICDVRRTQKNNNPVTMIYLNEGFHGTLRYTESWHTVTKFKRHANSKDQDSEELENIILWGPTCDSLDRVMESHTIRLPPCTPDDWLVFHSQGAYSKVFATNFSALDIPWTRPVISLELWNKIKGYPVFSSSDFIHVPDISGRLPSLLPSLPLKRIYRKDRTISGVTKLINADEDTTICTNHTSIN